MVHKQSNKTPCAVLPLTLFSDLTTGDEFSFTAEAGRRVGLMVAVRAAEKGASTITVTVYGRPSDTGDGSRAWIQMPLFNNQANTTGAFPSTNTMVISALIQGTAIDADAYFVGFRYIDCLPDMTIKVAFTGFAVSTDAVSLTLI